jgi:hypothetical protein
VFAGFSRPVVGVMVSAMHIPLAILLFFNQLDHDGQDNSNKLYSLVVLGD